MKKILLTVFFLFFLCKLFSQQPFCPAGAVWHYDYSAFTHGGFIRIEYTGDTLITGILCKKLQPIDYRFYSPWSSVHTTHYLQPQYIYHNGDTVFYFFNNRFFTLFNFGAQTGDEWKIADTITFSNCDTNSIVHVDSTGTILINGENLRWISVHTVGHSPFGYGYVDNVGKILERIGAVNFNYLFPQEMNCDTQLIAEIPIYTFHCYEDSLFSLYNSQPNDCEYLLTIGINEVKNENAIRIYPNPIHSISVLNVSEEFDNSDLEIYNIYGKQIIKQRVVDRFVLINRDGLPGGIYLFRVVSYNGQVMCGKFAIE